MKASQLSSPSATTSPNFAERRRNLVLNDDEDCDDTITITGPSQFESCPPPHTEGCFTPVPIQRDSISNPRQSFGVFLDDQFDAGKEPGKRFGVNQDDGLDNTQTDTLVHESPRSDLSDGDVTRNLEGIGIGGLMECDESAVVDGEHPRVAPQNFIPSPSDVSSRHSSLNSRMSLAYVAGDVLFPEMRENKGQDVQARVSLAPIGHERRADFCMDNSPDSLSINAPIDNIIDQLKFDEEEEEENNALQVSVSNSDLAESEMGSDVKPIVRPVLPESRKLFDADTTEEETIHFHDEPPAPSQQKPKTQSVERGISAATARNTKEKEGTPRQIPSSPHPPKPSAIKPSHGIELHHDKGANPSTQGPVVEQVVVSTVESGRFGPLTPFRKDGDNEENPSELPSSWRPPHSVATYRLPDVMAQNDNGTGPSTPPHAVERNMHPASNRKVELQASLKINEENEENQKQLSTFLSSPKPSATHASSDSIIYRSNGTGLSTPLTAIERSAPVLAGDNESISSTVRQATPHSATGSKIRATLAERASGVRRGKADFQLKQLANSISKAPQMPVTPEKDANPLESAFSVNDFLDECNVHFDKTFVVDQREASIVVPEMEGLDRSSLAARITESVKKTGILQRLQEEVARQAEFVRKIEDHIESTEDELVSVMPPVFAMMSRSNTVSMKELTNCRVGMKRLRKVSALRARLDWVQSRQIWEDAIRKQVDQVVKEGEHHISHLVFSEDSYGKLHRKFKDSMRNTELKLDANETDDSTALATQRKDLVDEFSYINDLKSLILSKRESEKELLQKKESLVQRKKEVSTSVESLKSYAGAMTDNKLHDKVTERSELNTLMCKVAGLRLRHIGSSRVCATIADLMDIDVKLNRDDVTEIITNPVLPYGTGESAVHSFINGAVSLCSPRNHLRRVPDLPFVLHTCAEKLLFAKNFLLSISSYFDKHIGQLSATQADRIKENFVDITFVASFYSLTKWTKFDIGVTVSTVFPQHQTGGPHQELRSINVIRFIGTVPIDGTLEAAIRDEGFRRNRRAFDINDAFAAVWKLIE